MSEMSPIFVQATPSGVEALLECTECGPLGTYAKAEMEAVSVEHLKEHGAQGIKEWRNEKPE